MERIETVVVGAGVIGLACARALALAGQEVLVLEAASTIGSGISSRNSEVIHAGIYYPTGSRKARLCVEGKKRLYDYCRAHGVAHRRCGKLIVAATQEEVARLAALQVKGRENGVHDLEILDRTAVCRLEPDLACAAALWSPSTGIVDSHGLMLAYQGDAEAAGAVIAFRAPFERGRVVDKGVELTVGGADPLRLKARRLVNAAGLGAAEVATALEGFPTEQIPPLRFAKGSYFRLAGRSPFSHLVYPLPDGAWLGVHLTLDLGGQTRFGPDVEWIDRPDNYDVDADRAADFYAAVRRYWPGLQDNALLPDYAGIRPKLYGPGEAPADFVISGPAEHGQAGIVNLFGIESPGLTSSLAIADVVAATLGEACLSAVW